MTTLLIKYVALFFFLTTIGMTGLSAYRGQVISNMQTEMIAAKKQEVKVIINSTELADKISKDLDVKQTVLTVEKEKVIREVEKIVNDPVYLNVCFEPSGLSALREAIHTPTASQHGEQVPNTDDAK